MTILAKDLSRASGSGVTDAPNRSLKGVHHTSGRCSAQMSVDWTMNTN